MEKEEWTRDFRFNLRTLIRSSDLSMRELSKRSGLSVSTISRYLNGQMLPRFDAIINLSIALNCDLEDFAYIDELIE